MLQTWRSLHIICSDRLEFDVFLRDLQRKNRSLTAKITLLCIVEWDFRKLLFYALERA